MTAPADTATARPAEPRPPRQTANPAPVMRPGSVRRTASIDVEWLEGERRGMMADRRLHGRVRDVVAGPAGGRPQVLAEASMETVLDPEKTIKAITATPAPARLAELVGQRGGNHLRVLLRETMPELIAQGAPLYLVLDDISGTSLVSGWAWSLWDADWMTKMQGGIDETDRAKMMQDRAGVCWGLQLGHSGMNPERGSLSEGAADGGDLVNPADPAGWHQFPDLAGVSMRRARRIDLWRGEDGQIHIDAAFQDSAPRPAGGRAALHEYRILATIDPATTTLTSLEPEPRVLPFHECPGAVANAKKLVGTPLAEIRESVLANLRGTAGCTHLNDALRSLAEVPLLMKSLPGG